MNKLNKAWDLFTDKCSGYFTNRVITLFGTVISSIIMLKLTWMGGLTVEYFSAYMLYVVGHASIAKFLDKKYAKEAE
jgi:hypothetical protein